MINKILSRRDFIKKTGHVALAIGAGGTIDIILNGCATIIFKEEAPVIYPPLDSYKVQPPINGCYIGFYKGRTFSLLRHKQILDEYVIWFIGKGYV